MRNSGYADNAGQLGSYYVVTAQNSLGESAPSDAAAPGGVIMMGGGETVIQRSSYTLLGQTIALKVSGDPNSANNGIFHYLTDHLGSTSMLINSNNGVVSGSEARYYPFGAWRGTTPSQTISERGYTGQRENMELGLVYMNAWYYVPIINQFGNGVP